MEIKIVPRAVGLAVVLFSFCTAILFSRSALFPGLMLVVVVAALLRNLYDNWGTLTIQGSQFEYRRRLGKFHVCCPVSAAKKVVIRRGTWFRSRGSVRNASLVLEEGGYRYTVSLGSPFFIGGSTLHNAGLVSQTLHVPIDDPQLETMRLKNFPFYKWNIEGKEWKTVLVIFGLALLLVLCSIIYKKI